jgi:hypothetical protein
MLINYIIVRNNNLSFPERIYLKYFSSCAYFAMFVFLRIFSVSFVSLSSLLLLFLLRDFPVLVSLARLSDFFLRKALFFGILYLYT